MENTILLIKVILKVGILKELNINKKYLTFRSPSFPLSFVFEALGLSILD